MLGAEDFRIIIETRWEQAWVIPQPGRNTWGDYFREFNKVSLVSQIIRYKPRINTKSEAKCLDKFLWEAPEFELVITKLGNVKDYLPWTLHFLIT